MRQLIFWLCKAVSLEWRVNWWCMFYNANAPNPFPFWLSHQEGRVLPRPLSPIVYIHLFSLWVGSISTFYFLFDVMLIRGITLQAGWAISNFLLQTFALASQSLRGWVGDSWTDYPSRAHCFLFTCEAGSRHFWNLKHQILFLTAVWAQLWHVSRWCKNWPHRMGHLSMNQLWSWPAMLISDNSLHFIPCTKMPLNVTHLPGTSELTSWTIKPFETDCRRQKD